MHTEHTSRTNPSAYTLKPEPYSSHTLLLKNLPPQGQGQRVLDVGCGPGYLAAILAARGFRVVALDRSLPAEGESLNGVQWVEADLDQGGLPLSGSFPFILCADVLEHLRDPLPLLLGLRNLLHPDGCLVASLPNSGNIYFRCNILWGRFPAHDHGLFDRTHLHFYAWDGWVDILARAGFRVEKVSVTAIPFGLAFPRLSGTWIVHLLEFLSYGLARLWKRLFAYQFVVVAKEVT